MKNPFRHWGWKLKFWIALKVLKATDTEAEFLLRQAYARQRAIAERTRRNEAAMAALMERVKNIQHQE